MSFYINGDAKCSCVPSRCVSQESSCPPYPPYCPPKPAGTAGITIPFSIAQAGVELGTDAQGNPQIVYFSGFGPVEYAYPIYLQEGEWATGSITFREDTPFGSAFIIPRNARVRNIYVLFSSKYGLSLESGSTVYPFACLAVSNSSNLVYTILPDTITYAEPYIGGFEYPKHTLRRGSLTNLHVPVAEGTLVAIVTGIRGENVTSEQYGQFTISGGLLLE